MDIETVVSASIILLTRQAAKHNIPKYEREMLNTRFIKCN